MLFANQRTFTIALPQVDGAGSPVDVSFLVQYLCDRVMKDSRRELFVSDNTVRPGILVLINDADWELEGEGNYKLQRNDHILFVSTLHGG